MSPINASESGESINKIDLLLKNALKKQVKQKNEEEQQNNIYEIRQNLKRESQKKTENVT